MANSPPNAPRAPRSNTQVTKREFDGLRTEIMTRFDDLGKQIQLMLPREIYEVRHKQVVEDTQDLAQRLATAEKAILELNSQLATARLAATQQISSDTRAVERQVSDTRSEVTDRIYDLVKTGFFLIAGAVLAFVLSHR